MGLAFNMNSIDASHLRGTEEIFIGDQESDCDDIDRRELIVHYANDKYLSKWEVTDDDEGKHDKPDTTGNVHVQNSNVELDMQENSKAESGHLVASCDCDDLSLVSYNSFRDGPPSATPKTAPASLPCHVGQLPHACSEELKLWQGYGGNIYFDAVRCQSMRINRAKSSHPSKQDTLKRSNDKSCSPSKRNSEQQAPATFMYSAHGDVPTSIHLLGSLRMRPCKQTKCRTGDCRHKNTTNHLPGKICKGFSEKLLTQTFQKVNKDRGCTKKPMAVSGGLVGDSAGLDPIDKVKQMNKQSGFPALISDSSFFSHHCKKKTSQIVVSGDGNPFIKLPLLREYKGKKKGSKPEETVAEGRKGVTEPTPVFIIPFGAFDDPVDYESEGKRKLDKKEKESTIRRSTASGIDSYLDNKDEILSNQSGGFERGLVAAADDRNAEDAVCLDDNGSIVKLSVASEVGLEKAVKPGATDLHLKREISNLSLTNYLRAVPTPATKEQKKGTSQSSAMPKMSYTKRSQTLPRFYMVNNSLHHAHHTRLNQRTTDGSQIYGGYYPSTGREESKLFFAEISTGADQGRLRSGDGSLLDTPRRSKSSGNLRRSSKSPRTSKHALIKASYVSRSPFTRRSVERSPRLLDSVTNSGENVFPITGQQISTLSGFHDG